MFTKPVNIIANEVWNALHSETGDGIINIRKYGKVPTTGYAVDVNPLQGEGFLSLGKIVDWVREHRVSIDFQPSAFIGAHRVRGGGDMIFEVHVFGSFEQAEVFARANDAGYVYRLDAIEEIKKAITNGSFDLETVMFLPEEA